MYSNYLRCIQGASFLGIVPYLLDNLCQPPNGEPSAEIYIIEKHYQENKLTKILMFVVKVQGNYVIGDIELCVNDRGRSVVGFGVYWFDWGLRPQQQPGSYRGLVC